MIAFLIENRPGWVRGLALFEQDAGFPLAVSSNEVDGGFSMTELHQHGRRFPRSDLSLSREMSFVSQSRSGLTQWRSRRRDAARPLSASKTAWPSPSSLSRSVPGPSARYCADYAAIASAYCTQSEAL